MGINKITSRAEAEAYAAGDKIECLECGKKFSFLPPHLRRAHGMNSDEYRERFNIPATIPLAGSEYRSEHREKLKRMTADGSFDYSHLPAATDAARKTGRGNKRDFDRESQRKLMANVNEKNRTRRGRSSDGVRRGRSISKKIDLFTRLRNRKMLRLDVNEAVELTQHEFLKMLFEGYEDFTQCTLTRADFAKFMGVTVSTVYGYFGSPESRDYRVISDNLRVAMIWQITSKCQTTLNTRGTPKEHAQRFITFLKSQGYNIKFSVDDLTEVYAKRKNKIQVVRGPHYPDLYITDFRDKNFSPVSSLNADDMREYTSIIQRRRAAKKSTLPGSEEKLKVYEQELLEFKIKHNIKH